MFPMTAYFWIKALHIISVIAWMAGLLYLPRLFVYHADAEPGSALSETFKVMERRLMKAIMRPAALGVFVFGGLLVVDWGPGAWTEVWLIVKLVGVAGLIASHACMEHWRLAFEHDENRHSAKFYRYINEVPTLLMIAIVILVVVKPF